MDGKNVFAMSSNEMAQNVAYVAQNARAVDMSVFDTVLLGRKPYIQWDATHRDREIVSDILRRMKLESYALRSVSELSGGEAQKVLIARALAQDRACCCSTSRPAISTRAISTRSCSLCAPSRASIK